MSLICNVKGHEPADYSLGNGGVIADVRTLTAICKYCRKDIVCYQNADPELGPYAQPPTPWKLRAYPAF